MPIPNVSMNLNVIDQVASAMSVDSLRHHVIASNIANRDSVGYQRLALRFTEALQRDDAVPRAVVAVEDATVTAAAPSLEQDMIALSGNAMHYQALARALARYFSIAATAASGGRG